MRATLFLSSMALCAVCAFGQGATVNVTLRGKVKMEDGSPPPKSVGLERVCSDRNGDKPGPLTGKQGEYTWRMDVNPMNTRKCIIQATLKDYTSTQIDISALNGYLSVNIDLPDLILSPFVPDPALLNLTEQGVPGAAKDAWQKASAAAIASDLEQGIVQFKIVTEKAPKLARGWMNLGILQMAMRTYDAAKASFAQALVADPKDITAYVMLARMQVLTRDWAGAAKTSADGIAVDKKRTFAELFVHQAAAQFEQKDLAGAEASALKAIDPKEKLKAVRGQFILAKIAEAKGDAAGAKEQAARYLLMAPTAPDKAAIQAWMEKAGQPDAPRVELDVF